MKILNEKQSKISKTLTESNGINENENIGKMISDMLFSPICDYFNNKYGDLGFEFTSSYVDPEASIVIIDKNKERKAPPFIILKTSDDYGGCVLTLNAVIKGQHGYKRLDASSLSEMCKLLEDYIIR